MDIQLFKRHLTERLHDLYESDEGGVVALRVIEEVTGKSYPQLFISDYKLTKKEEEKIEAIVQRLEAHEPLQYILGEVQFGGLTLSVAPGVLIPRPETEEMCAMMSERGLLHGAKGIDIGTGSGAIALFMALHDSLVDAIDLSADALRIARLNADRSRLSERISFYQRDLLSDDFIAPSPEYDLIVSNPPYVLDSERATMSRHVLEHEPESALFVPDDDPLLFYRSILDKLLPHLRPEGWVVFELNALTALPCAEMCRTEGLETELLKDMEGKNRFIFAHKK